MKILVRWRPRQPGLPHFASDLPVAIHPLCYPLDPILRTAVLGGGIQIVGNLRQFPDGWSPALVRYAPQSLAASATTLVRLAQAAAANRIRLGPLRGIVIAFTGEFAGNLSPQDRELIEETFGAPVFQQLRGNLGELLATECAAHSGLHIVNSLRNLGSALLNFENLEHGLCSCGSRAPRLIGSEPAPALKANAAAAG